MDTRVKPLNGLRDDAIEPTSMLVAKENILSMIAAKRHVIERTGEIDSRLPGHT
jgi:hypothetical protein